MAIRIENIQVDGQNDKRMILSNAGIARKLDIGNDWTRLRIGLRLAFVDAGENIGEGHELWIGTMSNPDTGLTNGPLGINCSHFMGVRTKNDLAWSRYSASDPTRYYFNTAISAFIECKKVGNTFTSAIATIIPTRISCTPSLNRTIIIFEFRKDAGTMRVSGWGPGGVAAAIRDYSKEELIAAMEINGGANSLRDYLGLLSGTTTNYVHIIDAAGRTFNEGTDGPLNSIVVAWNRTITPLIISEVLWAKMA